MSLFQVIQNFAITYPTNWLFMQMIILIGPLVGLMLYVVAWQAWRGSHGYRYEDNVLAHRSVQIPGLVVIVYVVMAQLSLSTLNVWIRT